MPLTGHIRTTVWLYKTVQFVTIDELVDATIKQKITIEIMNVRGTKQLKGRTEQTEIESYNNCLATLIANVAIGTIGNLSAPLGQLDLKNSQ